MASPELLPVWIALAAFVAVGCLLLGLHAAIAGSMGGARRRLERLGRRVQGGVGRQPAEVARRLDTATSASRAERLIAALSPRPGALQERIERAGLRLSTERYALFSLGCVLLLALLLRLAGGTGWIASGLFALALGLLLPHWLLTLLARRRVERLLNLLPEAIELMVRGMKAGLPIQETIAVVAREMADPVGEEFRRIDEGVRIGRSLDEAMRLAAQRIDSADFRFLTIAVSVQRDTGGNLTEALQNLADILRRRRQMQQKVRALSSEARASAYILGALPFIMLLLLLVIAPAYASVLFDDPRGQTLLAVAGGSLAIGVFAMWRMARFDI
ncbi:MAG: type II secretion system F family protein [Alphaproteobacteria bacterium]|nr:type II secretion system F family protein [Alphaproteobacteria bacterium]